jgi:hypothetical protein
MPERDYLPGRQNPGTCLAEKRIQIATNVGSRSRRRIVLHF